MNFSKRLQTDLKKRVRSQIRTEARIDKEINASCEKYRSWVEAEIKAGKKPVTIIAEGDSWGRYIVGKAVVYQLEKLLKTEILNLASPGDEVREMMSPKQRERLIRELKKGPAKRQKYDFFFFSGGGNDLVGVDRFHFWLHPYQQGMTAKDVLNKDTIKAAFTLLDLQYNELIEIRDTHSPNTHLLFHAYDFAIPDGRGVCGKGPWLEPGLKMRKVPANMRREVVKLFLQGFDALLDKIANKHKKITVVPTQGTLKDEEWANELHPKNPGFKKIAKRFVEEIENLS